MPVARFKAFLPVSMLFILGACTTAPTTESQYSDSDYAGTSFANYLVIGVAGSYNNRAQFERELVSGIRASGASATAYYNLAGNAPISRDGVIDAVQQNRFDAVVVTRVKSREGQVDVQQGSTGAKATTIGGRPVNFFRYDYEELNEPDSLNLSMSVTLTTELFAAADERMIQSFDTSPDESANVGALINSTTDAIVRKLVSDGRVRR